MGDLSSFEGKCILDEQLNREGAKPLPDLDAARLHTCPTVRLEQARSEAASFRDRVLSEGNEVVFYRSINLIRAPYPTKYGLLNAHTLKSPFMHILNRLFVVQYKTQQGLKTLLFSPSDIEANAETPYFKRLAGKYGKLSPLMNAFLAPVENSVESALESCGIRPEQVDYISYDHLHTQDLRKWLGTAEKGAMEAYFPNAKLLVMEQEWQSTLHLLPQQRDWYCPNGIHGISSEKVIRLSSSIQLGEGVYLVRTPGHTEGNHSLVVNTPMGVLVSSENGVSADSYSPLNSEIPGVRQYAKDTGMEVILNGNTLENSLDQYISMVMEKTIAGPNKDNDQFYNVVPSSELTPYWGFPGVKPTFGFGELEFGAYQS